MDPLVCGASLCDDCEHLVGPDGTNQRGVHGKKGSGKFKPWYAMTPEEQVRGQFHEAVRDFVSQKQLQAEFGPAKDPKDRERYATQAVNSLEWLRKQAEEIGIEGAEEVWNASVKERFAEHFPWKKAETMNLSIPFPFKVVTKQVVGLKD